VKTYNEWKALIEHYGVHPVFGTSGELDAGIEQNPDELAHFLVVCEAHGVQSFLEVGTGWKGGLSRFLGAETEWDVATFDIQDYGHNFPDVFYFRESREQFFKDYAALGGAYDVVMIDADHSYEGVKADHADFGQLAQKIIAFHDIAGLRDCEGVAQYWHEASRYPRLGNSGEIVKNTATLPLHPGYHEIIADGDQRGGIGYIVLSEVQQHTPKTLEEAIATRDEEAAVDAKHAEQPKPKRARKLAAKKMTASKAAGGKK
jgi:hypothetical protein